MACSVYIVRWHEVDIDNFSRSKGYPMQIFYIEGKGKELALKGIITNSDGDLKQEYSSCIVGKLDLHNIQLLAVEGKLIDVILLNSN